MWSEAAREASAAVRAAHQSGVNAIKGVGHVMKNFAADERGGGKAPPHLVTHIMDEFAKEPSTYIHLAEHLFGGG